MPQGYVAATRPLVYVVTFIIVHNQFLENFVPATCPTEFNLLNFMDMSLQDNPDEIPVQIPSRRLFFERIKHTFHVGSINKPLFS